MGNLTAVAPASASHGPAASDDPPAVLHEPARASHEPSAAPHEPVRAVREPSETAKMRPPRWKVMRRPFASVPIVAANARAYGSSGATTVPWLS